MTGPNDRDHGNDSRRARSEDQMPPDVRRLRDQVLVITRNRGDAAVHPPIEAIENGAPLEYIYRTGRILCRDADLGRVRRVVAGQVVDSLIAGVSAFAPTDVDVPTALARIDDMLGIGVATPDHFLWVTSRCCPATEPVPATQTEPDPCVSSASDATGAQTSVSVIDTGFIPDVAAAHPWLTGVGGDIETYDRTDIAAYIGHGTFIAGIVRCMAPLAEVRVEGFLTQGAIIGADGSITNLATGGALTESEIVAQLYDGIDRMPDVISMSAGCTTRGNAGLLTFETFYETRLRHVKGPVMVVAAGNDSSRAPFYPAAYDWTISVGAVDRAGDRAWYSNFGPWVDVYALGSDVVNAFPDGDYVYKEPPPPGHSTPTEGSTAKFGNGLARWSGTSFSTPMVAGLIAARMSKTGQTSRQAADSILRIARAHARPGIGSIVDEATALGPDPAGDYWA